MEVAKLAKGGMESRGEKDGLLDGPVASNEHCVEKRDALNGGRMLRGGYIVQNWVVFEGKGIEEVARTANFAGGRVVAKGVGLPVKVRIVAGGVVAFRV
jgi:hypothetical protein